VHALHPGVLVDSASTSGFFATKGELEKEYRGCDGKFLPIVEYANRYAIIS